MSTTAEVWTIGKTRRPTCQCCQWFWLAAAPPGKDPYRQPGAWWFNVRLNGQVNYIRHRVTDSGRCCSRCGTDLGLSPSGEVVDQTNGPGMDFVCLNALVRR